MKYEINFLSTVDDYEHDGDYEREIECWRKLGFATQFEERDEDGVPNFRVIGELSDERIVSLLNKVDSDGLYLLGEAIEMYDRLNKQNIWNKYKEYYFEVEKYLDNDNGERPIIKIEKERKIEDIIKPGKKGITNAQMIPTLKKLISENNYNDIKIIKKELNQQFESSFKYLSKKHQEVINKNL